MMMVGMWRQRRCRWGALLVHFLCSLTDLRTLVSEAMSMIRMQRHEIYRPVPYLSRDDEISKATLDAWDSTGTILYLGLNARVEVATNSSRSMNFEFPSVKWKVTILAAEDIRFTPGHQTLFSCAHQPCKDFMTQLLDCQVDHHRRFFCFMVLVPWKFSNLALMAHHQYPFCQILLKKSNILHAWWNPVNPAWIWDHSRRESFGAKYILYPNLMCSPRSQRKLDI